MRMRETIIGWRQVNPMTKKKPFLINIKYQQHQFGIESILIAFSLYLLINFYNKLRWWHTNF